MYSVISIDRFMKGRFMRKNCCLSCGSRDLQKGDFRETSDEEVEVTTVCLNCGDIQVRKFVSNIDTNIPDRIEEYQEIEKGGLNVG